MAAILAQGQLNLNDLAQKTFCGSRTQPTLVLCRTSRIFRMIRKIVPAERTPHSPGV
jgi:hypothetical protein